MTDPTDRRIAERRKRDEGCICMRYRAARISSWCRATTRHPDSDRRKAPQPPPKPEDETTAFPRAAAPGSLDTTPAKCGRNADAPNLDNCVLHIHLHTKKSVYVAHCLELDLVAVDDNPWPAVEKLGLLINRQIEVGVRNHNEANIWFPAPKSFFDALPCEQPLPTPPTPAQPAGAPYLANRADGVNGHYCIGRTIDGTASYWNPSGWFATGYLFFDKDLADAILTLLAARPTTEGTEEK